MYNVSVGAHKFRNGSGRLSNEDIMNMLLDSGGNQSDDDEIDNLLFLLSDNDDNRNKNKFELDPSTSNIRNCASRVEISLKFEKVNQSKGLLYSKKVD